MSIPPRSMSQQPSELIQFFYISALLMIVRVWSPYLSLLHSEHLGHISEQPRTYLDCLQCKNFLHLTTLLEIERVVIQKWMCLTVVCVLRYTKMRNKIKLKTKSKECLHNIVKLKETI